MCNCSKKAVLPVSNQNVYTTVETPVNCNRDKQELEIIKEMLVSKKSPENSGFINMQLGLIQTMLNLNNYCLYNIDVI